MKFRHEFYYTSSIMKKKDIRYGSVYTESVHKEDGVAITVFNGYDIGCFIYSGVDNKGIQAGIDYARYWAKTAGVPVGYHQKKNCNNPTDKYTFSLQPKEKHLWYEIDKLLADNSEHPIQRAKVQTIESTVRITNTAGFNHSYSSRFVMLNCLLCIQDNLCSYSTVAHSIEELLKRLSTDIWVKMRGTYGYMHISYASGEYPVILGGDALASIVSAFFSIFIGRDAFSREPLLEELRTDAGILEIFDDGLRFDGYASAPFDCEARSTKVTPLIQNNRLENMYWDASDEVHYGKISTGNKMKNSFYDNARIAPTNLIIKAHDKSCKEYDTSFNSLLLCLVNGYIIDKVYIVPGGINTITGNFKVNASGYRVIHGAVEGYIPKFTLMGNIVQLLRNVSAITSEFEWRFAGCPVYTPSVYINSIYII